jgi:hypothetical protein
VCKHLQLQYVCRDHSAPQGCQIFLGKTYQNGENLPTYHNIYQMSIKYTKWLFSRPNVYNVYHHLLPITRHSKNYPNLDFGLKIYHLATVLLQWLLTARAFRICWGCRSHLIFKEYICMSMWRRQGGQVFSVSVVSFLREMEPILRSWVTTPAVWKITTSRVA